MLPSSSTAAAWRSCCSSERMAWAARVRPGEDDEEEDEEDEDEDEDARGWAPPAAVVETPPTGDGAAAAPRDPALARFPSLSLSPLPCARQSGSTEPARP